MATGIFFPRVPTSVVGESKPSAPGGSASKYAVDPVTSPFKASEELGGDSGTLPRLSVEGPAHTAELTAPLASRRRGRRAPKADAIPQPPVTLPAIIPETKGAFTPSPSGRDSDASTVALAAFDGGLTPSPSASPSSADGVREDVPGRAGGALSPEPLAAAPIERPAILRRGGILGGAQVGRGRSASATPASSTIPGMVAAAGLTLRLISESRLVLERPALPQTPHTSLVGREAELTGVCLQPLRGRGAADSEIRLVFGGAAVTVAQRAKHSDNYNGAILAATSATRLDVPLLRAEVEGLVRGRACIELVTGPMTREEYALLRYPLQTLSMSLARGGGDPLSAVFERYNALVAPIFRLDTTELAAQLALARPVRFTGCLQYNESTDLRTLAGYLGPADDSHVGRDGFASRHGLMTTEASALTCRCLEHFRATTKSSTTGTAWVPVSKHSFDILPKFSPEDVVLTAMNQAEVDRLRALLVDETSRGHFAAAFGMQDSQVTSLLDACNLRVASGYAPLVLGKATFTEPGQVKDLEGRSVGDVTLMPNSPRPDGRIPLMEGPLGIMGVVEFRRASDPRNEVGPNIFESLIRV